VNESIRAAGFLTGVVPRGAEVLDALAVSMENERHDLAGLLQRVCLLPVPFSNATPVV
jgi:hypothetical protein